MIKYIEIEAGEKQFESKEYKIIGSAIATQFPETKIKDSNIIEIFGLNSSLSYVPIEAIIDPMYYASKVQEETMKSINDRQKKIINKLSKKYSNLLIVTRKISSEIAEFAGVNLKDNTIIISNLIPTIKEDKSEVLCYTVFAYRSIGIGILEKKKRNKRVKGRA